ncbi:MAG: hypothetical protein KIS62_12650 [Ramlibacter sp.]|nr:hypothetical protein [Ramlibacter sp.]
MPPPPLPSAVRDALQAGRTIEAIKLYRESSGLGLKEAKDAIDQYRESMGDHAADTSTRSPGEVPRSGPGKWIAAALAAAAAAGYFFFRQSGG